jgi:hypothetical protein
MSNNTLTVESFSDLGTYDMFSSTNTSTARGVLAMNKIDNNTAILMYADSTSISITKARVIKVEDNSVIVGNPVILDTTGSNSSAFGVNTAIKVGNKILIGYSKYIGLFTIDDAYLLNQESGDAITVAPTTGTIQGITTTECTETTAGDVYLLDS